MLKKNGFTLIEIIITITILGILSAIAISTYSSMMQQAYGNNAQNNLKAIAFAQKVYFLNHGVYYLGDQSLLPQIDAALGLNITDNNYDYHCWTPDGAYTYTEPYQCEARSKNISYTPGSADFWSLSFSYEQNNPRVPIYGISPFSPVPTLSCGTLAANKSYTNSGVCNATNVCPGNTINLGTTFDCMGCCACPQSGQCIKS